MKKADLEARRRQLNSVSSDSENDFDEIVSSARSPNDTAKITIIPLERLVEYSDDSFESITGRPQPFKAHSQKSLESLSKSIKENGVINPIIVRPIDDGKYQILAGRNRTRASHICGNTDIPAIVRTDIDDIGAAMIMLDTNLEQRPHLSYSEKAYAYKMRVDLQRSQGKRTDIEGGKKVDVLSEVGKDNNDSRRTVAYLIRLTYLILPIMDMIDDGRLGFKIGVAISYLSAETQNLLYSEIIMTGEKIKQSQIKELKVLDECGAVNIDSLKALFKKPIKPQISSVTISGDSLTEYADILPNSKEIERLFLEFLKTYRQSLIQA
ncbi:MAG: ParB/RepB/Spo0J family partition protein [Clostridiales bacterium]|nr:ParB/RepB/Spo0J family partition protein [Clostridiales bacterium]